MVQCLGPCEFCAAALPPDGPFSLIDAGSLCHCLRGFSVFASCCCAWGLALQPPLLAPGLRSPELHARHSAARACWQRVSLKGSGLPRLTPAGGLLWVCMHLQRPGMDGRAPSHSRPHARGGPSPLEALRSARARVACPWRMGRHRPPGGMDLFVHRRCPHMLRGSTCVAPGSCGQGAESLCPRVRLWQTLARVSVCCNECP